PVPKSSARMLIPKGDASLPDPQLSQRIAEAGLVEASSLPDDRSVRIQDEIGGIRCDPIFLGQLPFIHTDRERELPLLQVFQNLALAVDPIDGDHAEPLLLEFLVDLLKVRKLLAARAASAEPEVDQSGL